MAVIHDFIFDTSLDGLKIGHLNVCSLNPKNPKFCEIYELFERSNLDIIGISETWLGDSFSTAAVNIESFNFVRCDRSGRRGGGVGLYISKKIKFNVLFSQSSNLDRMHFEILVIEALLLNCKLAIGVIYVPPHSDIKLVEPTISNLASRFDNFILMGDFNCNLFEPTSLAVFSDICFRNNLSIIHNNTPTHYDVFHSSSSLLDVFLVNKSDNVVEKKQTHVSPSISKHSLIAIRYNPSEKLSANRVKMFRNISGIRIDDLIAFASSLQLNFILGLHNVDEIVHTLNQYCLLLLNTFAPLRIFKPKKRNKFPFMNSPEIADAKRLRDDAFYLFKHDETGCPHKWREYCKLRNRVTKLIKKKKIEFCESYFNGSDSKTLWQKLKACGGNSTENSSIPSTMNLDQLNEHFTNLPECGVFTPRYSTIPDYEDSFYFNNISLDELFFHLNSIKSNAVGCDDIPIKFIIMIFPVFGKFFLHLINTCLTSSCFPELWKTAIVKPIPKIKNPLDFKDIRPISILPAISKVLELILKNQILSDSIVNYSLYDYQSGFRKFFNTTTATIDTTDSIRLNMDNKLCTFLFLFDLTRAFDMIDKQILLYKLKTSFNFSYCACKLLDSYLSGRSQIIVTEDKSSVRNSVRKGVPQGSILGPLLFLIFINDISSITETLKLSLFADDIQAVAACKLDDISNFSELVNLDLKRIFEWCLNNGLILNEKKTQVINFTSSIPSSNFNNLFWLNDHSLILSELVTSLGFVIDRKLSWEHHVNLIIRRVNFGLRTLNHCSLSFPLHIRKKLAFALLVSQISYGLEVYSGTTNYVLDKLKGCLNNVVRFVYKIPWNGHISQPVVDFLGCSFKDFISFRCLNLLYKTLFYEEPNYLQLRFKIGSNHRNELIYPRCNYAIMINSFSMRAAELWNKYLPVNNDYRKLKILPHIFKKQSITFF